MFSLPQPQGPYQVGATTFALPVIPSIIIGDGKGPDHEPALALEEVAFTAFYPAVVTSNSKKGLDWLLRPIKESFRGYVHFLRAPPWLIWPLVSGFGRLLKIPVYPDAPLLPPPADAPSHDNQKTNPSAWPLVIFSHGLGGSRTAYSQICSRIASSGKVVLAIEHRDGTGHVCMPRHYGPDGERSEPRPKLYFQDEDVVFPDNHPKDPTGLPLRTDQLIFRRHEIYLAYAAFRRLVETGHKHIHKHDSSTAIPKPGDQLETIDDEEIDWESWTGNGATVDCENVALVGHSFGGATVFSILSNPTPCSEYNPIPVKHALALDPWLEPLPSPGPAPHPDRPSHSPSPSLAPSHSDSHSHSHSNTNTHPEEDTHSTSSSDTCTATATAVEGKGTPGTRPRLMVINSEDFTLWDEHFVRLKGVVEGWEPEGRRLFTLVRSKHVSFSDFPLIPVLRRPAATHIMDVITTLALSYLGGRLEEGLEGLRTRKMEVVEGPDGKGKVKRRLVGGVGDVVVH